jgi:hypothetical protein
MTPITIFLLAAGLIAGQVTTNDDTTCTDPTTCVVQQGTAGGQITASDDCTDPTTCVVQQGTAGGQL